jgi:hypothetical protein
MHMPGPDSCSVDDRRSEIASLCQNQKIVCDSFLFYRCFRDGISEQKEAKIIEFHELMT